mgnify:CR=1 FL=1
MLRYVLRRFLTAIPTLFVIVTISFFLMRAMVEVSSPYAPLFVIFLFAWMIAAIFIEIFDTGANTILQCYLLDREVGLCDDEHIPRSLKKFFSEGEIRAAMEKDKIHENKEQLLPKDGANNMV